MQHREDPGGSKRNTYPVAPPEHEHAGQGDVAPQNDDPEHPRRGDPRRREHGQQDAEYERRRHDLTEGHDPSDLERDEGLEEAVLIEHAAQLAQRAPRVVGGDDAGYQQDASARPDHAETELLVLVARELLVE